MTSEAEAELDPFDRFDRAGRSLLAHPWNFAKTMPENPHEYSLKKLWSPDEFDRTVLGIRALGYRYRFKGRHYTQLDVNEHYYWTMGAPVDKTILINRKHRAPDTHPAPYDAAADGYDGLFSEPGYVRETENLIERLGDLSRLSVLDVGCGTGVLLDYIRPTSYTGVDPSHAMLKRLHAKHPPSASVRTVYAPLRSFVGDPVDRVIALFGAASYLSNEELGRIPRLLNPDGRAVLMFYAPGYEPVTYRALNIDRPAARSAPDGWPKVRIGNYDVVELRP